MLSHDDRHIDLRSKLSEIVCRQPLSQMSEEERIALGKHRARAAIALLACQDPESALQVFRFATDPESLTQFVYHSKDYGVAPDDLVKCLDHTNAVVPRYGLLLALSQYSIDDVGAKTADALKPKLADWYANDPSSAIHGATGALLLSWGLQDVVDKVDQTPLAYDQNGGREWFVIKIGEDCFTFVVFRPGNFQMGSTETELDRGPYERHHEATVTLPLAIADREVTRGQFEQFLATQESQWFSLEAWREKIAPYSPSADHSAVGVSWPLAHGYCRWLTVRAQQWHAESKATWAFLRNGFRLPTEVEWEYACRGGTSTAFGFGSDREVLPRYGWFLRQGRGASHVGRELLPNLRGIFDMHGNAYEFCHDWFNANLPNENDSLNAKASSRPYRVLRGGGWNSAASNGRSASRHPISSTNAVLNVNNGFRLSDNSRRHSIDS